MDCHTYGHGTWLSHCVQFTDVTKNLKNVGDVIPHCAKVVHIVLLHDEFLLSAMAINMAFHLPHIMFYSI